MWSVKARGQKCVLALKIFKYHSQRWRYHSAGNEMGEMKCVFYIFQSMLKLEDKKKLDANTEIV